MEELICGLGILIVLYLVFVFLFNRDFHQGYNNSKFLDELKKKEMKP